MTSSRTRLGVLSGAFVVALGVVLFHLWFLMVQEQDAWARRSYANRSAFRSVPSQRGRLYDRYGTLLAWDEPTTRASIYYRRFRLYHVIGAAVHGATHWASLQPEESGATYSYFDGVVGPVVAAESLLSVPVSAFERGALSKKDFEPLALYATTVLSVCSGIPRRKVFGAMREAAMEGGNRCIGDVLPMSRAELMQRFEERLAGLRRLDAKFLAEQQKHNERIGRETIDPTLIEALERLRRDSLAKRKVVLEIKRDADGEPVRDEYDKVIPIKWGSYVEDIRRYFANDVAFELAAALRVNQKDHPGLGADPAIRRMRAVDRDDARDSSLAVMIGEVRSNDRLIAKKSDAEPDAGPPRMPDEWREELVPDDVVSNAEALEHMRKEADRRYLRDSLVSERSGVSGFEALCDDDLTGKLGMRFVEHDSRRREHRLWSYLRVESGQDVQVTIDVDLQEAVEYAVREANTEYRSRYTDPEEIAEVEANLAIIDARTGDVLALAGAPIKGSPTRKVSGFVWEGNGSIGSLVKPFLMVEHLESKRLGRPSAADEEMKLCEGSIKIGGRVLKCDGTHFHLGLDPTAAIAKSCNVYFYQAGVGLGVDGVRHALERFGLGRPSEGDPLFAHRQSRVPGLWMAEPRVDTQISLPRRSIGYGVQAPALYMARAYAGIATGVLPDVGLRLGVQRDRVYLGDIGESLAVVHRGMADCVRSGTGRELQKLKDLGAYAKTGTAEISRRTKKNNGWFAGFMPWTSRCGVQLAFCAVVYRVPPGVHGGKAAGGMLEKCILRMERNPELYARYLIEDAR